MRRALLVMLSLAAFGCGGAEPSAPPEPTDTAGGEGAPVEAAAPRTPVLSHARAGHVVRVVIDMARVRESAVGPDIASLIQSYPTWRELLGDSGIEPVRDFDRVLVLSPAVYSDEAMLLIRHRLSTGDLREAVLRMGVQRGEAVAWRQERGFDVVDWPVDTTVPRVVVVTGVGEIVVVPRDQLSTALEVAADHAARREDDGWVEPALALDEDVVVDAFVEDAGEVRYRYSPDAFTVRMAETRDEAGTPSLSIEVRGTFEDAEAAAEAREALERMRTYYADQMLVRAVGLDRPLRAARIGGEGEAMSLDATFTEQEIQRILGLMALRSLSAGN
jgi:hypothetical protein